MEKRITLLAILFLLLLQAKAQDPVMVWVSFKDKDHSPFSLSRPHEFLSQRSLERRQRQMIPLDNTDLPVSPYYLNLIETFEGVKVYYTSKWLNGAMLRLESPAIYQDIAGLDFVVFSEIVKSYSGSTQSVSPVDLRGMEMHDNALENSPEPVYSFHSVFADSHYPAYGATENQINMVNGSALHQRGFWGRGLKIALLDAGYRFVDSLEAFQYLWHHNKILGWRDFVNPGGNVFREHPHGTYVLSVMGGYLPGTYAGAALGASYWLIRTEDAATEFRIEEYNWLAGAELADSIGADIINSSLGYTRFDDPSQSYTYSQLDGQTTVVARAANYAFSKGILVVNSAGNYGAQTWQYIGSPADAPGVLAVGGTNSNGNRVNFSSVGPSADGRTKPDVMAQAQGVAVINLMGSIGQANGTSFSSPLVAAMAACLWQSFPLASADQLKEAIIKSADRYFEPDTLYGFGIPDFEIASQILNQQIKPSQALKIIKNPITIHSSLRIFADDAQEVTISIYNASGQSIFNFGNVLLYKGYNDIRAFEYIESMASGIYFVKVNFRNRTEMVKAIKL